MQALVSLQRDHQQLASLSDALGAYVAVLEAGLPLVRGDLQDIMHGFRALGDYRHFEKEDELMVPWLVRHGFDYQLEILEHGQREHARLRYLIDVLEQSAERELNWSLDERQRITRQARSLIERQRRLATRQERELFPAIEARLEAPVLGQLTEQLGQFDALCARRGLEPDVRGLRRSVLARYASTLPSSRELAR